MLCTVLPFGPRNVPATYHCSDLLPPVTIDTNDLKTKRKAWNNILLKLQQESKLVYSSTYYLVLLWGTEKEAAQLLALAWMSVKESNIISKFKQPELWSFFYQK